MATITVLAVTVPADVTTRHDPALRLEPCRPRPPVDGGAGRLRRAREPAHVGQRLERSGAPVEHAARIAGGAGQLRDALPVQQLHGRAAPLPLLRSRAQGFHRCRVRRRADPAGLMRLAGDLVAGDQLEHEVGGTTGDLPHPPAHVRAELLLELVWIVLESRDDLTAVASGSAPAGLRRVEHHHVGAALGQVQRRRQTRVAGADHRHVGAAVSLEGPRLRQGLGRTPGRRGRIERRDPLRGEGCRRPGYRSPVRAFPSATAVSPSTTAPSLTAPRAR